MPFPAMAQMPGWQFSPLPGEGDRAAMGCDRDATSSAHTCLVVRCEDDFTTGLHLYSSRFGGPAGRWTMTLDREDRAFLAEPDASPYRARIIEDADWLLDRLRYGTFVYLRHEADAHAPFAFIDLSGSMTAIAEALYWCAPRVPESEQNLSPGVDRDPSKKENSDESSPPRP
ncbi:hypothetical protein DMC47_08400 [Nostoc sp. 3335mG]|nr:hypothetical protein DMC47_08400 [Nostoc sp. 3335mG]